MGYSLHKGIYHLLMCTMGEHDTAYMSTPDEIITADTPTELQSRVNPPAPLRSSIQLIK